MRACGIGGEEDEVGRWVRGLLPAITVAALVSLYVAHYEAPALHADHQDYQPSSSGLRVLLNGQAAVQNQGTALDPSDAVGVWNDWTSRTNLWVQPHPGCGSSVSCIIYAVEGSYLYYTSCRVPHLWELGSPGADAKVEQIAGAFTTMPDPWGTCSSLAASMFLLWLSLSAKAQQDGARIINSLSSVMKLGMPLTLPITSVPLAGRSGGASASL
jgi:hypothetical protein